MKKFWTVLALVAFALNMSSVSLWAEDMPQSPVDAVISEDKKDEEASLGETALVAEESLEKADEAVTEEVKAGAVVKTDSVAVTEEKKDEKSDAAAAVVPVVEEPKIA